MSFSFCKLEICACLIFSVILLKDKVTHRHRAKQMNRLFWFDFVYCAGQRV